MYIQGRGKIGYLTEDKKAPAREDPTYATWDVENSMVMMWLVNSMDEDMSSNYMCRKPLPPIVEVFSEVRKDESRKRFMLGKEATIGPIENSELAATNANASRAIANQRRMDDKPLRKDESRKRFMLGKEATIGPIENSELAATNANASRAIANQHPWKWANWKSNRPNDGPNCGYPSANEAEMSSLSKEKMDQLRKLLKSNSSSGIPSVSLAQIGCDPHALACCSNSAPWIIDSSASDYMTNFTQLLTNYSTCPINEKSKLHKIDA
ncbi:hypothetical protein Acr_00g0070260 [Actinidia rufa]|uniref:Uncharacterized protein n=1 Tax=Actinidia rufa TaxID=165716 RepID=A0A7J0DRE1_9ERIC|nr:hypothetical protein Acr_00g0070260 [Actinidia rufa]